MAKDERDSLNRSASLTKETVTNNNESFVKKVSSRVSGILPSISKWFSRDENKSMIRYRDDEDDDDDENQRISVEPPSKKIKLPPPVAGGGGGGCRGAEPIFKYNNFTLSSLSTVPIPLVESPPPPPQRQRDYFAEPIAGPSGVKSRKLMLSHSREQSMRKDMVNGDDNNSDSGDGDSTSGYSSMAARIGGSKEQILSNVEKPKTNLEDGGGESLLFNTTSPNRIEENTRTLFHERSFTPRSNSSLSSRRPSFSASNFGSPTFIDRTISTQRVLNSPFYNGRTIYGGASAYGRKLGRSSSELRTNLNTSVEVKPKNNASGESMVLSKTARRILDTLEQYTTPVNDAKKIPVVGKRGVKRQEGFLTKYTGANPYRKESKVASNTELHVPTVPELLKMKQQLQESTEAVRQIATNSKSQLNKDEYTLPASAVVVVDDDDETSKHTSKIKTKVCTVRQKSTNQIVDAVEPVKLPTVSLPISTLPKFDFSVPPPASFSHQPKEPQTQNKTETKKINSTMEYKFSEPLVITENIETIIGVNNFKFSEPIVRKQLLKNNFKVNEPLEFKPKKLQKNNGEIQPATQLISGSVMDVLNKFKQPQENITNESVNLFDKFKPQAGTWECTSCLVRNQPDKIKCVACETPKTTTAPSMFAKPTSFVNKSSTTSPSVGITTTPSTTLMDKFKPAAGTWECNSCLVRNQPDKTKCVACETAKSTTAPSTSNQTTLMDKFKPAAGTWECSSCLIRNQPDKMKCVACETTKATTTPPTTTATNQTLMDKFKPAAGTWECTSCLVRNQPDKMKCVACETPKATTAPSTGNQSPFDKFKPTTNQTLMDKFKPAAGTWECTSCLVRNQPDKVKCVACETPKATTAPPTTTTTTNQTLLDKFKPAWPKTTTSPSTSFMAQFKPPPTEGTWECSQCMIRNKNEVTRCAACACLRTTTTSPPKRPAPMPESSFSGHFKVSDKWQCTKCKAYNGKDSFNCFSCKTAKCGFGEQFKSSKDTWECDSCMVRNQMHVEKCVACESLNPKIKKQFNSGQFKKTQSEWECPSCMVKNSTDKAKCVCCETAKPGSNGLDDKSTGFTKYSFGVDKQAVGKFTFGIKPTTTTTTSSIFNPPQQSNSSSFVFGATTKPSVTIAPSTFTFGSTSKTDTNTTPKQFQISPVASKETETTKETEKPATSDNKTIVTTTTSSLPSIPTNLFNTTAKTESNTLTKPTFSFGTFTTTAASETKSTFASTTTTKPFTFGSGGVDSTDVSSSAVKMPSFSFGQKTEPKKQITETTATPAVTQSSAVGGFSFFAGGNKAPSFAFNAASSSTPPTTVTTASQPTQNGFGLGSTSVANNGTGGFSFGKTTAPTTGVFSLGNSSQPVAGSSGSFNFSATGPPSFNPSLPPTYNFTSGSQVSFSAQASTNGTALGQRKYKRALRRNR